MFTCFRYAVLFLMIIVVSACVTTTNGRSKPKIDTEKSHDTHVKLGLAYLQRGNRENSRRNFERALEINSRSAPAQHGMGLLYQLTGDIALAEEAFSIALDEDPDFTQARIDYGRFLYQQKRYQEAHKAFDQASQDLSYEKRAVALAYLGQSLLKLENKIKAKSVFEHAVNINNKLALPMIELAELYFDDKDYAKSKAYLDRYIDIAGRTPRSLWLGIRMERIFGNKDKEASYVIALKNLHPYSKEYLLYKNQLEQDQIKQDQIEQGQIEQDQIEQDRTKQGKASGQ